jgi:Protein tyrosine and serine/threonine kinase
MAPEVALGKPYKEKCDVFSFGILLYEIISLRPPFCAAITQNYSTLVAKGGKRPYIKRRWPSMTKAIMKSSWKPSPCDRPSMENNFKMIKVDLKELDTEERIASRIDCNANMSRHSSSRYCNLDQSQWDELRHEYSVQSRSEKINGN